MNGSIEILIDSTIMEAYRVGDKDAMRLMYRAIAVSYTHLRAHET